MERHNFFASIFFVSIILLTISSSFAADRPKLITEDFYAHNLDKGTYGFDTAESKNLATVWHKLLLSMGIEKPGHLSTDSWSYSSCRYDTALAILQQIRLELGESTPYQKIWAKNQDQVFAVCDTRHTQDFPPEESKQTETLPQRAQSDFLYQLASWHFYRREYDKAMALYQRVESELKAPLRANSAYMTLRCLSGLYRSEEAYEKAGDILADTSLKSVHGITGNYRFVIMNSTYWPTFYITPELATKHLSWLVSLTHISPAKSADLKQAFADYFDALEQLDGYFPLYDSESHAVDWWLMDAQSISPRMQAVKTLAPQIELVDWFQAQWAYNVFTTDWLWALHYKESPYWSQNRNIVEHAWKRWLHGDGGEWLRIAVIRVHPHDVLAKEIIQAATPYLSREWKGETLEYREWLFDLWENLIRIHLGREEYPRVISLIKDYGNFKEIFYDNIFQRYSLKYHGNSLEKILRWLVYAGKTNEARGVLTLILQQYPNSFKYWRTLLATRWSEVLASARSTDRIQWYDSAGVIGNSTILWQSMANLLPTKELFKLAIDPQIDGANKGYLARSTLTRAFLLRFDNDLVDQYAVLVAKLNPAIREQLLSSVSQHKNDDYVDFMLRMPRFRPQPYTGIMLSETPENNEDNNLKAIDKHNHKDNNWWCRFDQQALEKHIFDAMRIMPYDNDIFQANQEEMHNEFEPYIEQQKGSVCVNS